MIGVPMWLGLLPGSRNAAADAAAGGGGAGDDPRHAGGRALGAPGGGAPQRRAQPRGGGAGRARRRGAGCGRPDPRPRLAFAGSGGVLRVRHRLPARLPGGIRPTPTFWAVAMAYLVGMLANSIPIPGGFFAVEGGIVGMLLLFGVRPGSTVLAAVVTYRAISLWVPALIGTVAFLSLRGEIGKPLRPRPASTS